MILLRPSIPNGVLIRQGPEQHRNTKYKDYGISCSSVPGYKRSIADWKSSGMGFKHVKI